jgi:hypothetical protein
MDDFVPDYQGRAWPEYKGIGQAGICVSRQMFGYVGVAGILTYECRHILRYAGLTFWCVVQEQRRPDYLTS